MVQKDFGNKKLLCSVSLGIEAIGLGIVRVRTSQAYLHLSGHLT